MEAFYVMTSCMTCVYYAVCMHGVGCRRQTWKLDRYDGFEYTPIVCSPVIVFYSWDHSLLLLYQHMDHESRRGLPGLRGLWERLGSLNYAPLVMRRSTPFPEQTEQIKVQTHLELENLEKLIGVVFQENREIISKSWHARAPAAGQISWYWLYLLGVIAICVVLFVHRSEQK